MITGQFHAEISVIYTKSHSNDAITTIHNGVQQAYWKIRLQLAD